MCVHWKFPVSCLAHWKFPVSCLVHWKFPVSGLRALEISSLMFGALEISSLWFGALEISSLMFGALEISSLWFGALEVSSLLFGALEISSLFFLVHWKFPVSGLVHWKFGGNLLEISTLLLLHQSLLCFFATLVVWFIGNFPSLVFGTLGTLEISSPKRHRKYLKCKWEYLFNYASTEFPLTADAIGDLMGKKEKHHCCRISWWSTRQT